MNQKDVHTFVHTFFSPIGKSHIDITLCTYNVNDHNHTWLVKDKWDFFTDHRMTQVEFSFCKVEIPQSKRYDWKSFKNNLQINNCIYDQWSPATIDREAEVLTSEIRAALNSSTFYQPIKQKVARWWNNDLNSKKMEIKDLFYKIEQNPNDANLKNEYASLKKIFKKSIQKAKRESWQKFCSSIDTPKNMSIFRGDGTDFV